MGRLPPVPRAEIGRGTDVVLVWVPVMLFLTENSGLR